MRLALRPLSLIAPAPLLPPALALFLLAGCGGDPSKSADTTDAGGADAGEDSGADGGLDDGGDAATAKGACDYINTFSGAPECKEYVGSAWDQTTAAADCASPLPGADPGALRWAEGCGREPLLGICAIDVGAPEETALVFLGDDPAACGGLEIGCGFAGGELTYGPVCEGSDGGGDGGGGVDASAVFVPFEQVCAPPVEGEPAGASDGEVCTWQAISGCTEPGRDYLDYGSCDPVFTQRPYWPGRPAGAAAADDPRLSDPAWVEEYAWVTDQVESCACVCCHSSAAAPEAGPSGWFVEDGPIWVDGLDDDGLAVMAGWVDSTAFGAFDPADNNGFDRSTTGIPTSDVPRMLTFLEGELRRRGLDRDDFSAVAPFGGPLYDQLFYEPGPCADGQGIDEDGVLRWTGGDARYLYVLDADSQSPGVPPNLDLPEGTLWRIDVAPTAVPIESGVTYGVVPEGASQAFPEGAPAPLAPGEVVYLYVLKDIYQPLTRCLMTVP